jgi:hypothetical protein
MVLMSQSALRHEHTCEAREVAIDRSSREIYDELLLIRCRRRDVVAWDELVDRWYDWLVYYLRRLIDNEHDATNALQEVGLNALPSAKRCLMWHFHFPASFASGMPPHQMLHLTAGRVSTLTLPSQMRLLRRSYRPLITHRSESISSYSMNRMSQNRTTGNVTSKLVCHAAADRNC